MQVRIMALAPIYYDEQAQVDIPGCSGAIIHVEKCAGEAGSF